MSKQLTFFLLPDDMVMVEKHLKEMGDVAFLAQPMYHDTLRIVEHITVRETEQDWLPIALARKEYIDRVHLYFSAPQNYSVISMEQSEVVEFTRCFFDGNILRQGRLYTTTGYYDDKGVWQKRDPGFLQWTDSIYRWFKKAFQRNLLPNWKDHYMSTAVVEWVKHGGLLVH